jgi:hypothetical protein
VSAKRNTLTWYIGGYPITYRPSKAGPWGCALCSYCHRQPQRGDTVWMNDYLDLVCDPCARRNARRYRTRG